MPGTGGGVGPRVPEPSVSTPATSAQMRDRTGRKGIQSIRVDLETTDVEALREIQKTTPNKNVVNHIQAAVKEYIDKKRRAT